MILASKHGLMIAVVVQRETPKAHIVKEVGRPNRERRVSKSDKGWKLFDSTEEAMNWMDVEL